MTIPATQLVRAKDLLLFGPLDIDIDPIVSGKWDEVRDRLCREFDLFVQVTTIAPVAKKFIYSVPVGTTRIFSVAFNQVTLGYTDRGNLNLQNPEWEIEQPGTPRKWLHNAIPGEADSGVTTIGPREFLLYPAPDGRAANGGAITVIYENRPADVPRWMEPILLYLTVGEVASENPNCMMQPEKAEWFTNLGNLWMENARKLMQV